jgi:hypothetical protein
MKKVYLRLLLWLVVATAFLSACQRPEPAPLRPENTPNPNASARTTGTYEAEGALLSGPRVATSPAGYTGTGFADYVNASGDFIEWTVSATAAGSFSLQFRYANGGTTNRALQLKVNGITVAANLAFAPTGGWATWSLSAATANLVAGPNKIRLTTIGANGPNVDHLQINATASQSGTLEAEAALLRGPVAATNQAGYTGTGFADFVNATGDVIEWTVSVATPGSFSLQFRYANGGSTNRPLQLRVNETVVASNLAFSPTGGWASWAVSSATANLVAGPNKIRLTTTGANGPNVDHLTYGSGSLKHVLYLVDNGLSRLLFLNQKDPAKSWTVPVPAGSRDLQLVANNKILVSHGNGAAEYDRTTGAKGWSVSTYAGVSTAQRLSNGNTLLGWSTPASATTPAQVMFSEVNPAGTEVSRLTLHNITTLRLARRLANGNTLFTGDLNNDLVFRVFEVNAAGAIVWQQSLYGGRGYVANRLPNGDTQATIGPIGSLYEPGKDDNKLLQLGPTGAVVKFWGGMTTHPNARLRKFSGYSVVPGSGNVLIANWLGDGNVGTGPHAVEFDADNNLVWSWEDHAAARTVTNLLVVE